MSKAKVSIVTYTEFIDINFKAPTAFYNKNAMGDYVFYHTRSRETAQDWCNIIHGVNQYKVNAAKITKSKGDCTVSGSETRRK